MALIQCKECSKEISEHASACPLCGAPQPSRKAPMPQQKTSVLTWVLSVPLVAIFIFFIYALFASQTPEAKAKNEDRKVIDLCRKDEKNRLIKNESGLFPPGYCYMLELEFMKKYQHQP